MPGKRSYAVAFELLGLVGQDAEGIAEAQTDGGHDSAEAAARLAARDGQGNPSADCHARQEQQECHPETTSPGGLRGRCLIPVRFAARRARRQLYAAGIAPSLAPLAHAKDQVAVRAEGSAHRWISHSSD